MPNWNGHLLFADSVGTGYRSGVLLPLTGSSTRNRRVTVTDDCAEVSTGASEVIIRFAQDNPPETLLDSAAVLAADALDILAAEGGPFVTLGPPNDFNLLWWTEGAERFARIVLPIAFRTRVRCDVEVIPGVGRVLSQTPKPSPVPHESLRYFRLSQCTDSLFDAFRNAYLALESILADIRPKAAREREREWLLAALRVSQTVSPLSLILGCPERDLPHLFYQRVYTAVRCPLFHSKALGLDPANPGDRQLVLTAYELVIRSYLSLAAVRFNLSQRGGGGLTPDSFDSLRSAMDRWSIRAGSAVDDFIPGELAELARVVIAEKPDHVLRLSRTSQPFEPALEGVQFIAGFSQGELAFRHRLEGVLYPEGLNHLEVLIDLQNGTDPGYRLDFPG